MKLGLLSAVAASSLSSVLSPWVPSSCGRSWHTSAERLAERYRYIAQAICDYRARNGMLPDNLEELVPDYLTTLPGYSVQYWNGVLVIGGDEDHRVWPPVPRPR